jgi:hypothetical protein
VRAAAFIAVLTAAAVVCSHPLEAQRATDKVPTLSVEDYVQIRQLVASYAFGLDGGGNNGYDYADLFAPGAEFVRPPTTGRDNLAKLALDQPHGPIYVRHFITNIVIEPTATAITGKQYLVVIDVPEAAGQTGSVFVAGHYEDEYVKTPQGWRFKRREFIPSRSGAATAPAAGRGSTLQ